MMLGHDEVKDEMCEDKLLHPQANKILSLTFLTKCSLSSICSFLFTSLCCAVFLPITSVETVKQLSCIRPLCHLGPYYDVFLSVHYRFTLLEHRSFVNILRGRHVYVIKWIVF
jgi:hypothetical protein